MTKTSPHETNKLRCCMDVCINTSGAWTNKASGYRVQTASLRQGVHAGQQTRQEVFVSHDIVEYIGMYLCIRGRIGVSLNVFASS